MAILGPLVTAIGLSLADASFASSHSNGVAQPGHAPPEVAAPAEAVTLEGRVRGAGERPPVVDARILVIPAPAGLQPGTLEQPPELPEEIEWQRSAFTTEDGRFVLEDVPAERVLLVVLASGYQRIDMVLDVPPRGHLDLFARPEGDDPYRTVVRAKPEPTRSEIGTHTLDPEEIRTLPGSQGDTLRALQNLPGAARAPGSLGLLVLRGAPPDQSGVFLNGHRLPRAFHVLALSSLVPSELVETLRYSPSNFDAAFGNRTGGVVEIVPRRGRRDGFHGHAELDLAGAAGSLEGPLGEGSFIVAAQRSYIDAVLEGVDAIQERVTGEGNNLLRPSYYDYQGLFSHPLGGGTFGLTLLGGGDRLRTADQPLTSLDPPGFAFRNDFHRIDLSYTRRDGRTTWFVSPSFRYEVGVFERDLGNATRARRRDFVTSFRAEVRRDVSKRLSLTLGSDFEVDPYRTLVETDLSEGLPGLLGEEVESERDSGLQAHVGVYSTARLRLGPATLEPGVRAAVFTASDQFRAAVDPRFNLRIEPSPGWELFAGVGRYSMMRDDADQEEIDLIGQGSSLGGGRLILPPVLLSFNPAITTGENRTSLGLRQAWHVSGGAQYEWGEGWSVRGSAFLRDQDNGTPVFVGDNAIRYTSHSRAWGLEALVRKRLTDKLYAWASYTLMWSRVTFRDPESSITLPSDFDARHNLVLLASYLLPKRWQIGARFRLATGYPYTPIIGSIQDPSGFFPVSGELNSGRLGLVHQLDIRVDKRWILNRTIVSAYLDIQNIYNSANPEAVLYSGDFRRRSNAVGVPIFPSLGLRIDF